MKLEESKSRRVEEHACAKPTGGIEEYDLLQGLVQDERAIQARTLSLAHSTSWGAGRCRMAAIIEATAERCGWQHDAERRALVMARQGWAS